MLKVNGIRLRLLLKPLLMLVHTDEMCQMIQSWKTLPIATAGNDDVQASILKEESIAFGGPGEVQRQISTSRLENSENRHYHLNGSIQANANTSLCSNSQAL